MSDARIASKMSERELQDAVLELARYLGWLCYHTHDSRHSAAGFPDLVMIRERVIYAELKSSGGTLSADQCVWRDRLVDAGAQYHVWRPRDWTQRVIENELRRRSIAGPPNPVQNRL